MAALAQRLHALSARPVDAAWLAAFRVLYGSALCVSMLRFLLYGWVERLFVAPTFRFTYYGFEWVQPLPGPLMHALFWVLAVLAAMVASGAFFRVAALLFALGLSYVQLLDVSTYLNHYYLAALLSWLLALSPAHRTWSVDAWRARRRAARPVRAAATQTVAFGWLLLLRFQVGLVYFFAGMAKAQPDWLLHGQPLRIWLGQSAHLPLIGPLLTLDWVPLAMSWAGFLFDTTVCGFLLWRRTRPFAYAVVIVFHVLTRMFFPIGMFPVIMVIAAMVFFEPDWPRRFLQRLGVGRRASAAAARPAPIDAPASSPGPARVALGVVAVTYCALQLFLPLRAHLYGGNVLWHEQGMRFAWRVMVRAKGGSTEFVVRNRETGRTWYVSPREYLTPAQETEMSGQPDLILQLAHHVERDFERRGLGPVEVRARSHVSLNGRRGVPLVDPEIDLTTVRDGLARAGWIAPAPRSAPPHTRVVP
ncbi:MAG: HTTM domain-containing protein [Myxococcales bacterium]|jgi:hypothetical protein